MKHLSKLQVVNRWLGVTLILILISGIQLEVTSGRYRWTVWTHILLGLLLIVLSVYHIFLHYRRSNWFTRFQKNRNLATRILWWVFLLTAVTGLAATIGWLDGFNHTHLGAIHGKIGFLMAIIGIVHCRRHLRKRNVTRNMH